ncbi:ParE toxin of type II toxin-antitoxin system, parDE [uncultured archaeon]|nr:ParE toxin of type II toxin-antitoxin system, parDE [uncultured archaeon]
MYEIIISETAFKQLQKIEKNIQERIISALERIRIRPEAFVTKLVDEPAYKFRIGDYRAILEIDNNQIRILKIGHRKNTHT